MPDGLFHQRPSNPPPVDLESVVREVVEFEDSETHERNVTVPIAWEIISRDESWPLLIFRGLSCTAEGQAAPFQVARRIPARRALPHEVRTHVERACLALAQLVEERRRVGHVFESGRDAAACAQPPPTRDRRRRANA